MYGIEEMGAALNNPPSSAIATDTTRVPTPNAIIFPNGSCSDK